MNFYSDDVINHIIDNEAVEDIIPMISLFREDIYKLFYKYSHHVICPNYIQFLLQDDSNKIAFRCIDTDFILENCPSILIYHKDVSTKEITYYILMICTKHKFKKHGYASALLDDFIIYLNNKHKQTAYTIVLSSVESAVTFYESYGFKWTRESLINYPLLMQYEKYEEDKEYFILKYTGAKPP